MDIVKLGRKGQLTIPKAVLRRAGIDEDAPLIVDAAPDGSIVLRPAGVYPIEAYSDARIAEFERENAIPPELERRVERATKVKRRKSR